MAAPCLVAAGVWAVAVPPATLVDAPDLAFDAARPTNEEAPPIDVAVFDVPLWVEPPVEVAAAPVRQPPPPPPVKLQLLAVVRVPADADEPPKLQAAIYDPESDRLHFVSDGQRVGRFMITAVHDTGATLTDGERDVELTLAEGRS